jgi:asparagine N-glycosylation enzyme membrane subunit Stt3
MNWYRATIIYIAIATMMSPVFFPLLLTPVDNDVWFHLSMVRDMRESADLFPLEIRWINSPKGIPQWYPLLFHWVLYALSFGKVLDLVTMAVLAQLFLFPCALIAVFFLARHIGNPRVAFFSMVLVSTFFPFFSRTHNCIPEALQHILIPLTILAYLKGHSKTCGLLLTLQFLNHLIDPFLIFNVIVIHRICSPSFNRFSLPKTVIFASPGVILQLWWLTVRADGTLPLARSVYTVQSGFWSEVILNGILPSYFLLLLVIYALSKRIKIPHLMLLLFWIISLLPILVSKLGSRFPAYFVTPASLIVAPIVARFGSKLPAPEMGRWALLFLFSIIFSYAFFGHTHDLTVPAVSPQLHNAMQWIDAHTPQDAITLVNPKRTYYDGVRIYFFTKRHVTELSASADVHLSYHSKPASSAWRLSVEFDGIYVYTRRSGDGR